ncbi:glycosyltransferase [Mycobacterium sp. B14F4]|uniref:glycosyltransferase n=1 Tax=Mycobacterium sp. B14F4 TaxID=3153565 RepID=UPI00325E2CAF
MATGWLVDAWRADGHAVTVINTQAGRLAKLRRCLKAFFVLLIGPRVDRTVVVASGGAGLAFEVIPLLGARLRRVATTLTHHSSRYVRESSWTLRIVLAVASGRLRHAVLDEAMGAELSSRYGIEEHRIVVVDNAGLMPLPPAPDPDFQRRGVVHLSNLSAEKGLAAVLEVANQTGICVRLLGAPSEDAVAILDDARRRGVPFAAGGPRRGEDKFRELATARCMVFPSSYRHEAQPLVLYEAAAAGCVPIVWRNGWIGEQLDRLGLGQYVFDIGDVSGIAAAVKRIAELDDHTFAACSADVRAAFEAQHNRTRLQFRAVVE